MSEERNDPWFKFDALMVNIWDFFAAIGVVCTLAFIVGYFWGRQ